MASRKREGDGQDDRTDVKKPRSGPSFLPPQGDLNDIAALAQKPGTATADEIARKRAEIAAKFAAMKGPPRPSIPAPAARAPAPSAAAAAPPPAPTAAQGLDPNLMKKVAEARKRVMALAEKSKNPYLSSSGGSAAPSSSSAPASSGIHPLLAQESAGKTTSQNRYKPMVPKFATVKANLRSTPQPAPSSSTSRRYDSPTVKPEDDPRNNPYFDARLGDGGASSAAGAKDRSHRELKFNQKGKFIRQGEQARSEARLEELKRRIAESSRKAGLDEEMETVEKQIRRPPPPTVEWWDEDYLPNKTYDDVLTGESSKRIRSADSPVTIYIQHPIQLPAPQDKLDVGLNPLKLTKVEMKKMRRQRRRQEHQDKQDRQKMGLLPPPPPKVKLSNMMKVLTTDHVADPTKIEARVRREMQQRRRTHERENEARKLTEDEKREKVERKKEADEAKGIHAAVFRIRYLSNPQHRFKVRKNAEQHGLTGVTIFHPKFALVVAEGGQKGMKAYKHLLLDRINWTEEPLARSTLPDDDDGNDGAKADGASPGVGPGATEGEGKEPASLKDNRCDLIWEGQSRDRAFKSFRPKNCPSDGVAKQFLGPRMEGFWDVAKRWTDDG